MSRSKNSTSPETDRRQWQRIFGALVEMVRSQQSQIETLANDRKFLERYIQIQHNRWATKAGLLESHIAQIKEQEKKGRKTKVATLHLLVGMKQRETLRYKKQFEEADIDLEDFRAYVEALLVEIAELKEKVKNCYADKIRNSTGCSRQVHNSEGDKNSTASLEEELQKLKQAYNNLISKKETEVSALLAEKDFVWNQLNKMESDYISILKIKRLEVEKANETIQKLQSEMDNLRYADSDKNEVIVRLESEQARLESELTRHTQEAEKTSHDAKKLQLVVEKLQSLVKEKDQTIEELRSNLTKVECNLSRSSNRKTRFFIEQDPQRKQKDVVTPVVSQPRRSSRKRGSENSEVSKRKKHQNAYEDSSTSHASSSTNGLQRCSRGKRTRTISPAADDPRLFSASFKVPKLKNTSPSSIS
ncbi:MAR-binding filament-like protein 1-1 [Canna indica]|uniref:MAR-binding filament-like protein 1-1 n=1 Tax=Canna indica TaxID=4628 RepID=A0AAQ3QHI5_9LILI|nr:MAR-binding filament-like protein 1-1 [Canna indica]